MIESVLIDQREPLNIQVLDFDGAPTVVTLLDYGDVHVLCRDGALLVIERKTPDDFLNSLRDDRLMTQLTGLKNLSPWPYLIIDGQFQRGRDGKVVTDGRNTGWSWDALQGALLTVQEIGVNVLYSGGEFEHTVIWLAKHGRGTLKVYPRRAAIFATPQEQVLASLPGIGETRAPAILSNHAGDLKWALCSLLDPTWEKQSDIGPKTKINLRRLFNLSDDQILWPYTNDIPNTKDKTT